LIPDGWNNVTDETLYNRKYTFLLVSALAAFVATLDASIVNVSLPTLSRQFNSSVDMIAWISLAYSLTISATLLVAGRMAVRHGYRFTYMAGFSIFALGSLLCALAVSIETLIAARVLQGIGASFLMASGPALITRAFPANERGKGMGLMGTIVGVGLMSGPPLGGFLVSSVGWPSIFLINIPIGIFGFIYSAKYLKLLAPDDPVTRIDIFGGVFQGSAIILILLFFNRINQPDWPPVLLYSVLGAALLSLALFIWRERRTQHPLLGLSLFRHTQFTLAIAVMIMAFIVASSGMVLIPFFLEELLHLAPMQVGLVLVTIPICTMLVAPIAGRISDSIGVRFLTAFGLALFAIGTFWIATLNEHASRFDVIIRLTLIGIGQGIFHSPNSSGMMSAVPRPKVGLASGVLAVARNLGFAGGVAVGTAAFAYRNKMAMITVDQTAAFVQSFHWVITAFGFLALAAAILSAIRQNRPQFQAEAVMPDSAKVEVQAD
jgi:EmrB/QacA subfamily drug resistance transporter